MNKNQFITFFIGFILAALLMFITKNAIPIWAFLIGYITGLVVEYFQK